MIQKNNLTFSSLKSLGHSDLVKPTSKLNSTCPIKAFTFPVPYTLQEETLNQLSAFEEAGII